MWIGDDRDIRVHSHAGQDPITTKDCVRRQCGLPPWVPKQRKPKPLPPLWERIQFLAELLKIARGRARITFEQYALIINDLKNASLGANLKSRAPLYAREFGFTPAETDAAMRQEWRSYTAAERADTFKVTYDEYRRLGLRRSGCIELNPSERRCLTKQRYNAKRRAERAAKRVSRSADQRAPLCPSEKVGTVRVPSSKKVVGLVVSRVRGPCNWPLDAKVREAKEPLSGARGPSPKDARIETPRGVRAAVAAAAQTKITMPSGYVRPALLRRLEATTQQ